MYRPTFLYCKVKLGPLSHVPLNPNRGDGEDDKGEARPKADV